MKARELTTPATIHDQIKGYEFVQPNIHLICMLDHVKGTHLQMQNSRISKTQDNRTSKRSSSEK